VFAAVWSTSLGWDTPSAGCQSKATVTSTSCPVWTVVVSEFDMLVYLQPLFVPAPQRGAVNTALASRHCHWQLLFDKQADCVRPRFW